jgi:Xaa-Pro aminopeptidase
LITLDQAVLWTDSRYYIQAEKELDNNIWKMIPIENSNNDLRNFIQGNVQQGKNIALDFKSISISNYLNLTNNLKNHSIIYDKNHILDDILNNKKIINNSKIILHELKYAGKKPNEKFRQIFSNLKNFNRSFNENNKYAIILNKLDDIACIE